MNTRHLKDVAKRMTHRGLIVALLVGMVCSFFPIVGAQAATITVTNTNDKGAGSLRQAISSAAAGDTISFDSALNGKTITLTSAGLTISKALTIAGPGPGYLAISGGNKYRVFGVSGTGAVTISGLTIRDGRVTNLRGAGINNTGKLTVNNCVISGNQLAGTIQRVMGFGGVGIYNSGTLIVTNSTITGNNDVVLSGGGGGVFNDTAGTLTLSNSTVSYNSVHSNQYYGKYGGGGICNRGKANISGSIISDNTAIGYSYGGGAGIYNDGTVSIVASTLERNQSLRVTASSAEGGFGGGLMNFQSGQATVEGSTINGNRADRDGGGAENTGTLTVVHSAVISNIAKGIAVGKQLGQGGAGISNDSGTLWLANSTVSGNQSNGYGGGVLTDSGTSNLLFSTISNNIAGVGMGGGIYAAGTAVNLTASIIADSTGSDCITSAETTVTNVLTWVEDGACGATLLGDPALGPLQNNGGATWTQALPAGSPAIDAASGAETGCGSAFKDDQRGITRPQGLSCDLGAYEFVPLN
jgi:hypothetical protein